MIGIAIMTTLLTFIVEYVSEKVLPWRLFLKLFSNVMFVLIGKTVEIFKVWLGKLLEVLCIVSFSIYKPPDYWHVTSTHSIYQVFLTVFFNKCTTKLPAD